jgi:hypothetical protein
MRPTSRIAAFASMTLLALTAATPSWAQPPADPAYGSKNMIEIGGGAFLGTGEPVEALIRVDFFNGSTLASDSQFVLARVSGDVVVGANGVSYVDVALDSLGFQRYDDSDDRYLLMGSFSLLNVDIERNIAIDNEVTLRVTLVGLRGEIDLNANEDLKVIFKGAVDLVGLGYTQRLSDGASLLGLGGGATLEAGLQIQDRYRVAIGVKDTEILGKSRQVPDGMDCYDYELWDGSYRTRCRDTFHTIYDDQRGPSRLYATLEASISDDFKVFAQGACQVYSVVDRSDEVQGSREHQWQLVLGGSYAIRY